MKNKRGSCCIKKTEEDGNVRAISTRQKKEWIIDKNIPIFKGENRRYINELILFKE